MGKQVISGHNRPLVVIIRARKPLLINNVEVVFPAPRRTLLPFTPMELADEDADIVQENHARTGLVILGEGEYAGESIADAIVRAKIKRAEWLTAFIDNFKEMNAQRRAQGTELMLPRQRHRNALEELKKLKGELLQLDAELLDTTPLQPRRTLEDPTAAGLAEFGITKEAAPLVPPELEGLTELGGL